MEKEKIPIYLGVIQGNEMRRKKKELVEMYRKSSPKLKNKNDIY